jgi:FAD/FMN-containing dehydrogenase
MTKFEPGFLERLAEESSFDVLFPGDDGYDRASTALGRSGSPAIVAQPATAQAAAAAVLFAAEHGLTVSIRCGGHSASGYSTNDDGMVIDLSRLTSVDVIDLAPHSAPDPALDLALAAALDTALDPALASALDSAAVPGADVDAEYSLVSIGGGAVWGDIAEALRTHDLTLSSGDTSSVGVGGLTLGGGVGWMVRQYGLALDSLVEAEVVTAAGDVIVASALENADLFWALRGGGGNFGIVTRFTFRAHALDGVYFGAIQFENADTASLLRSWRDVMRDAPEKLNTTFLAMPAFGGMPAGTQLLVLYAGGDEAEARAALAPLLELDGVVGHNFEPMPYTDVLAETESPDPGSVQMVDNNGFVPDFSDSAIATLASIFDRIPGSVLMIRYLGGAFNRVPTDATAFAYRDSEVLLISAAFLPPDAPQEAILGIRETWGELGPHVRGIYGNFSTAVGDAVTPFMYPPETLARLERIKGTYDPGNLFDQNHNIRPVRAA